jgi:hypothetical protein
MLHTIGVAATTIGLKPIAERPIGLWMRGCVARIEGATTLLRE